MVWHDAFAHRYPIGDTDLDPDYKEKSMVEQLMKVIDSESARDAVPPKKFKPIEWVYTDDGYQVRVTAFEAQTILNSVPKVPLKDRPAYLRRIQNSPGLCQAIEYIRKNTE